MDFNLGMDFTAGDDFDFENRILSTGETKEDTGEVSLRPQALTDYVGQEKVKENLKIYIEAAKKRGDSLDHVKCLAQLFGGDVQRG